MENFKSQALDLVGLLESPWSSWASSPTDSRQATFGIKQGTIGCKMLALALHLLFCSGGVSQIISYYLAQNNVSY